MQTTSWDTVADLAAGDLEHLHNIADNLQLIADMGYGDVALAVPQAGGFMIVADARPTTAAAAVASSRVGRTLPVGEEPEAQACSVSGEVVVGSRTRSTRGISYVTSAWPVALDGADAGRPVIIRNTTDFVLQAPGSMERSFMRLADGLTRVVSARPLRAAHTNAPFSTTRRAGDGVFEIDATGGVAYASPNAVNILRSVGIEGQVSGARVSGLLAVAPAIEQLAHPADAHAAEVLIADHALRVRAIALEVGSLVLLEDVTDARRSEREIQVKEATIREVHHRVKNNLQTIASLLRIQARRTDSEAARRALHEAVERISSMAVVHEKLTTSTDERVDFADVATVVVDMVRRSLVDSARDIKVSVEGTTGDLPAPVATSLALVTAELVHNAIEHGLAGAEHGTVQVVLRRHADEVHLVVRDDGIGLPQGFDPHTSANLGLTIVSTVVEHDLHGTLAISSKRGTTVTLRVPLARDDGEE